MAEDTPKNADFIGRVVGDAANPPDTRMLTGWLGDAGEADYRRLYTDAELSSYVDIPADAILYTEPIRDAQPAGAVFVWIKRDAAVKQGGSAYSRAARFLQGQVQQDYASGSDAAAQGGGAAGDAESLEKAGLRCATQAPCGEVTGFTGQCTNEPQVGGAWPCITARPHCAEPTGFTGQCTHQPWPNPTRYIGCTIYHCPTHDLTHIPPICNIVATGIPGCGGINPPDKGDPAAGNAAEDSADNKKAAAPATSIPGCGYTQTWGLCETHLLGCGQTKECPTAHPGCGQTNDCPTTFPGCGWSKNPVCTDLPGCGFTKHWGACQQTLPPKCQVSIDNPCIPQTEMPPQCGPGGVEALGLHQGAAAAPVGALASQICATNIACNFTQLFCHTHIWQQCHPTIFCPVTPFCPPTRFQPQCFPIPSPFCPVTPGCPFGPGGGGTPVQGGGGFAAFGAAANVPGPAPIQPGTRLLPQCNANNTIPGLLCPSLIPCPTQPPVVCQSAVDACPTVRIPHCGDTQPPTAYCTQFPAACQTNCGTNCQTQQLNCTQFACTQVGPQCPTQPAVCPTVQPGVCPTHPAPCPTQLLLCTQAVACPTLNCIGVPNPAPVGAQAFGAQARPLTQVGCPVSDFVACSQFGGCQTQPNGDCTFFGGCPTHGQPHCPPTPATVCTQFAPCPTHHLPCHTPGFECTMFCTHGAPGCPPDTHAPPCTLNPVCRLATVNSPECPPNTQALPCPPHTIFGPGCQLVTVGSPQCPVPSGLNCPSAIGCQSLVCQSLACQSIACQSIACQPGGGGQQEFAAAALPQTAATVCTQIGPQCPRTHLGQCPSPGIDCTAILCTHAGPQCPHTRALGCTHLGQCPSPGIDCTVIACTHAGPLCPHTQPPQCRPQTPVCPTQFVQCNPSAVDACPTRLCTHQFVQCNPSAVDACPTRLCTQLIQCNPSAIDACPTRIGCPTHDPQACPPASGFNCPSQFGCQSIACGQTAACVSAGCQPGGGGQQVDPAQAFAAFGAAPHAAAGAGGLLNTQFRPQCPGQVGGPITWVNCYTISPSAGCYTLPPRCTQLCPTIDFLNGCTFFYACRYYDA